VDEFYFEEGYVTSSYFVYVANATAGFTPYIAEGYLPNDFFEDRGAFAAIFCDAEIVVGMLLEAQAFLSGTFSINAGVQRFLTTSIALTSSFTQTAIGTRGQDTDLFAFSDAAISVQISRIRSTNITVSSVFSVATDFVVKRNADADVDAIFSAIINGLRSRDTITQTQAAFSFDVAVNVIKGFDSTITAQSTAVIVAERLRGVNSSQNSEFTQTTAGDRIRFCTSAITSTSTVTANVRKIRDAHLTGTGVAAIACDAVKTTSAQIALASVFSQQSAGGFTFEYSATLTSHTSVFVSRYAGSDRPKTILGSFSGSTLINSATRITDLSNLTSVSDWYYQTRINLSASNLFRNYDTAELLYIPLGTRSGAERYIQVTSRYRSTGTVISIIGQFAPNNTVGQANIGVGTSVTGVDIGISFTGGQRFAVYINGQRVGLISDVLTNGWTISNSQTVSFSSGWPFTLSPSSVHTAQTDYAWLTLGNYTNSGDSSYSYSLPTNTEDTLFLYQFNGNGVEDLGATLLGAAAVQSQAAVSATVGYVATSQAAISVSSSVVAVIGTIEDINLVAFSDAAVTAAVTKIKALASDISSNTSVSTLAVKTASIDSSLTSASTVTASAERTRDVSANIVSQGSILTAITNLEGTAVNLVSSFTTLNVYLESGYLESGYYTQFETNVNVIASGSASLSIVATLTAGARTDVFAALVASSQASITATVVKTANVNIAQSGAFTTSIVGRRIAGGVAATTAVFTVFCNAVTAGEINLVAFTNASVSALATSTKPGNAVLISQTTVFAYTQDSLNSVGEADITSEFSTNIVAVKSVSAVIVTESVASSLSVVVKAVAVQIPLDCNFTQTATALRIRPGSSSQSVLATSATTAIKTATAQTAITAQSTVVVNATKNVSAVIVTQAVASTLTANIRIAGLFIDCAVTSTVSATARVTRRAVATIASTATVSIATVKLVSASAAITSRGSVSATVGVRKPFTATFTSALTFVVAIRDLRLDEIVYVIPGENYTYVINSESRLHEIYGETRIRSVTGESRIRTIIGESRIHIID
jgi:hypothetical protein